MDWKSTPIFILAKDRQSCLQQLLERLMRDDLTNIFIVDSGSTYPPMLDYLATLKFPILKCEPLEVHAPKFVLWDRDVVAKANQQDKHFVYTDCDVVPDPECPSDWLQYLYELLKRYADTKYIKAGLGLRVNDLPKWYKNKQAVLENEIQWLKNELEPNVFASKLDTTMSLYQPDSPHSYDAIRTGGKYLLRHLPWYYNTNFLPEEESYYMNHLHSKASFWTRRDKPTAIEKNTCEMSELP